MLLCSQVLQNDRYDSVKEFQCVNKLVYVLTWLELKISRSTSVLMSTHKLLLPNKSLCLHLVNSSTRPVIKVRQKATFCLSVMHLVNF